MVTVVSRPRLDRESDQRESRRAIDGMKMERGKREEEEEEEEEEVKRKRKTAGEGGLGKQGPVIFRMGNFVWMASGHFRTAQQQTLHFTSHRD